jgi:hypothetical protein
VDPKVFAIARQRLGKNVSATLNAYAITVTVSLFLLSLRTTCSHQQPVLKHPVSITSSNVRSPGFTPKAIEYLKAESSSDEFLGLITAPRNCAVRNGRQVKPRVARKKLCHNDLTTYEPFPELLISFAVFQSSDYLHIILILGAEIKRLYWIYFFI